MRFISDCAIGFSLFLSLLFLNTPNKCAAGSTPEFGKVTPEEWQVSFPDDFPEANAVVIFDRCSLVVAPDGIEIMEHVRMKILRAAGAEEIGDVEIPFRDGDRLKDLKAQTIHPDGTVTKVSGKEMFEKTVDDWKVKTFSFPSADSGCVVEYSYRNLNERFGFLRPWYFQSDVYTMESRFSLVLYPGFSYSNCYSNIPPEFRDPVVTEAMAPFDIYTKLKCFTWERHNLPPVIDEPYMGVKDDYYSALHYQLTSYKSPLTGFIRYFIKGWQQMGEELTSYFDDFSRGVKAKPILAETSAETLSPIERTKALYDYVASRVGVKDHEPGDWFSHSSLNEMIKEGFGTPDEKNVLLTALLRAAGIRSWPVMISTRDHRKFNPEIYQTHQFNRIICYAQIDDTSGVYMDASTKYCPFGVLPPECLVDGGFLVDDKQSQLVKVLYNPQRTYRLDATHMRIDSLGAARCSTICSLTGYAATVYGKLSERQALADFIDDYFLDKVSEQTSVISQELTKDSTGRLEIRLVYTVPDYARELDNNLVVRPVSYRYQENPFSRERRFYPIDFEYPFTYHNVVVIESDRGISSATLPPTVTSNAPGITFKRQSQFADGKVQLEAKLTISDELMTPDAYADVRRIFEDVAHATQDEVILQTGEN